jgi:putative membrane protein
MLVLNGLRLGWLLFGGTVALVLALALIMLIVATVDSLPNSTFTSVAPSSSSALAILKERYARGEITKEDYENMRRTLTA